MGIEAVGMRENHTGVSRYDYANNYYSSLSEAAKTTGLEDTQTIDAAVESGYALDGTKIKDENHNGKIEKKEKIDAENASKSINSSADKKAQHSKNKHDGFEKDCPLCQCETCKNRRYQDGSDDGGVSFKNPTTLNPTAAAHRVKSHEMEHVRREQYKAKEEGRTVISQSVQIKTDICEDCGKTYVSGGTTRTSTKVVNADFYEVFRVGAEDITQKGDKLDKSA